MDIIFWTGLFAGTDPYRPIGAYQMAHWMRKNGYECQVIDFIQEMTGDELASYTEKFIRSNTLCIGISSTFWSVRDRSGYQQWSPGGIPEVISTAIAIIKSKYPNIKLVLGGAQSDNKPQTFYNHFDAIIVNYGEDTFLELIESWRKKSKLLIGNYQGNVPYLTSSFSKRFDIAHNDHRFIKQDCIVPGETLPIEIGRGCIFNCKFCSYYNIGKTKNDYLRDVDLIRDEIVYNKDTFDSTNYILLDDTFNDSNDKMSAWGDMVSGLEFNINYTSYMRLDLLARFPEQISMLKETGLVAAHFGVETFHPEASLLIGKGWNGKKGKDFLLSLRKEWGNDALFMLSLIVGIPPETEKECIETNNWLVDNNMPSWTWHPLRINTASRTNKSEFEKNYKEYGFKVDSFNGWTSSNGYNHILAKYHTAKLMQDPRRYNTHLSNWKMLSYMSLGFTRKEVMTSTMSSFDQELKNKKYNEFIIKYKQLLNDL
jgi:radical SAM superfamily enzyme YgiQ (UPF0313 family)